MAPLSLEAGREMLLVGLQPLEPIAVPLTAAAGRVLAAPVRASRPFPPFPRSLVDGYALGPRPAAAPGVPGAGTAATAGLDGDHPGSHPGWKGPYRLVGTVAAGSRPEITLEPGTAVAIYTGARPPSGTVAVVPREMATRRGEWLWISGLSPAGQRPAATGPAGSLTGDRYLQPAGAEVEAGEEVLSPGTVLGPAEIGLLAALGIQEAAVYRLPRVALTASGSELMDLEGGRADPAVPGSYFTIPVVRTGPECPERPGPAPAAGDIPPVIYNSNFYALGAAISATGGRIVPLGSLADNLDIQARALQAALEDADLVLTTGGTGGGAFDFTAAAFARAGGQVLFNSLAMRPGRQVIAARSGAKLMLGLPGTPSAALVAFYLLAAPLIRTLAGREPGPVTLTARLARAVDRPRPERAFHWALLGTGSSGLEVTPLPRRPGGIRAAIGANALIDIPAGTVPVAGEEVRVVLLN